MSQRVRFFLEASEEIEGAANWYGRRSPAAQATFLREIDHAIAAILDAPQRWTSYIDGTRRYVFRKFPYSVVYSSTTAWFSLLRLRTTSAGPGIGAVVWHNSGPSQNVHRTPTLADVAGVRTIGFR
jgi:plasmid stabilization system protein ParE